MPTYRPVPFELDVSRAAVLLDTNILVAAFSPADQKHANANAFLEIITAQMIVPIAVVIEAWGMLVGSLKFWEGGFKLLDWLNNPGNAVLMVQQVESFGETLEFTKSMHIDCIDALLMHLANDISDQCDLNPPIQIATYDTSDFVRCVMKRRLRIRLINPDTLEELDLV